MAESKRVKKFVRVRYTGTGVTLGVYGRIEAGEIFSMKRRDWEYLEDQEGGVPDTMEKVGDSDLDLPKETPQVVEATQEDDEQDVVLEEAVAYNDGEVAVTEGGEVVHEDDLIEEPNPNPRKRKHKKGGK